MSCVKMKASFVLIQYVLIDALLSWLGHLSIPQVAGWCMQMGYIPIPRHTACSYRSSVPSALFFRVLSISNVCLSALNRWSRGRSSHSISGRIWHQGSSWPPVTWKGLTHSTQGNQQFLAASCGPCQIQKDKKNRNKKDKMCKLQIKMFGLAPECVLAKKLLCWYGLTAWSFISVSAVLGLPQDTKGWHKLHSLPESISMLWVSKLQQG